MRPHIPSFAVCLIASALLAACTQRIPPPCPHGGLLQDAASLTAFRDGPGRDITDIQFKAGFSKINGTCEYLTEESKMTMSFQVVFDIEPGPTADTAQIKIPYFVAIVKKGQEFFNKPGLKNTFTAIATLPESHAKFRYEDAIIDVSLPLNDEIRASEIEVIFGFQLTEEQLLYNRASIPR